MATKRRSFTARFKRGVTLEAVKGVKFAASSRANTMSTQTGSTDGNSNRSKKERRFSAAIPRSGKTVKGVEADLYERIGRLKVQTAWACT